LDPPPAIKLVQDYVKMLQRSLVANGFPSKFAVGLFAFEAHQPFALAVAIAKKILNHLNHYLAVG
jgi:hypothetical protein